MLPEEIASTKKIAAIRIHVERKMQRIKSFRILSREIDNSMFNCVEQLVFVCAMLTNFQQWVSTSVSAEWWPSWTDPFFHGLGGSRPPRNEGSTPSCERSRKNAPTRPYGC